jgi:hypothetical protein
MYDFLIEIPFNENSNLEHVGSMWSAVAILMHGVSGVIDTAHQWSAVSLTPPTTVHLPLNFLTQFVYLNCWRKNCLVSGVTDATPTGKRCHYLLPPAVSGVIDTTDHKIGDFKVEFLGKYEFILKKVLTSRSVSQEGLFVKKQRSKIS